MAGASDGRVPVGGAHLALVIGVVVERRVVDPEVVLPVHAVPDHLVTRVAGDAPVEACKQKSKNVK